MARPKITVIGELRRTQDGGLVFSASFRPSSRDDQRARELEKDLKNYHKGAAPTDLLWLEALENAYDWPHLGKCPVRKHNPSNVKYESEEKEFRCAFEDYLSRLHVDENYRKATAEFAEKQRVKPQPLFGQPWSDDTLTSCWIYRDKVVRVDSRLFELNYPTVSLLVKYHFLRQERGYEKIRREVEALENMEKLECTSREPIPDSVRLFVWQRDGGQCVKCGSREKLEFDHVIPVVLGGSNTERNIQLLCETCNRSKGSTI